jgi:tRNA threonylcarbamoyladenosine biosynthesis protein TsaB
MLAIDTATDLVGIALAPVAVDGGEAGAELQWKAPRRQTTTLLAQIDALMRLQDLQLTDLGAVAVSTGPGSFNALRVGLSAAKGLCFGLDIPIFGIGALDALAYQFRDAGKPVRAFIEAGRGRVVTGDYLFRDGVPHLRDRLEHRERARLAEALFEPTIIAGELAADDAALLAGQPYALVPSPSARRRRPGTLLDIAAARWQAEAADDLHELEPIYVHAAPRQPRNEKQPT